MISEGTLGAHTFKGIKMWIYIFYISTPPYLFCCCFFYCFLLNQIIPLRKYVTFSAELEKRIPLTAQPNYCAELEELQELLHFPEEVALRLADTEYQLFYQVSPPTKN